MQDANSGSYFRKITVVLLLVGMLLVATGFSALTTNVTISNSGYVIEGSEVTAQSGSAHDIQAAVDAVAATGGGTVHIPAGNFTFNLNQDGFNGVGEGRTGVQVPGGVNVIGAGNNQTVLYVPINAWRSGNTGNYVFDNMFTLDGRNNRPIRISGIVFQGSVDYSGGPTTDTYAKLTAVSVLGVRDFRIDHCNFIDFTNVAIYITNNWVHNPTGNCGVVDHVNIDNPYKDLYRSETGASPYWGYGIIVGGDYGGSAWDSDWTNWFGQYHHDITYIEDCFISRTRHAVAGGSQSYGYYVLRNSVLTDMIPAGYGSYQDVHGGGEGCEAYDNIIINTPMDYRTSGGGGGVYLGIGLYSRGGFALYYNNIIRSCSSSITLANDQSAWEYARLHGVWIWGNTYITSSGTTTYDPQTPGLSPGSFPITQGVDFWLRAPNQAQDGFTYTPYPYPHPLAQSP